LPEITTTEQLIHIRVSGTDIRHWHLSWQEQPKKFNLEFECLAYRQGNKDCLYWYWNHYCKLVYKLILIFKNLYFDYYWHASLLVLVLVSISLYYTD
jgi:hypothetical protein